MCNMHKNRSGTEVTRQAGIIYSSVPLSLTEYPCGVLAAGWNERSTPVSRACLDFFRGVIYNTKYSLYGAS